MTVIAELLGVPSEDLPRFRRWAEGLFSLQDVGPSVVPSEELNAQVAPILREMNDYLLEHLRVRRSRHTDDLLGRLTTARVDGQGLDDEEVLRFRSPFPRLGRVTRTDVRVGGRDIPADVLLCPWVGLDLLMRRWRDIAVDDAGVAHNNPWVMIAVRRLPVRVAT